MCNNNDNGHHYRSAIQSTFAQLGAYCVGDTPDALLGTSIEGITGTWSPAVISTASSGTSTYTFTIDAGQCALGTTMDVDITAPTTPTFTQIAPICINTSAPTLPTTSDNGVTEHGLRLRLVLRRQERVYVNT